MSIACPKCQLHSLAAEGGPTGALRCPSCRGWWLPRAAVRELAVDPGSLPDEPRVGSAAEVDDQGGLCPDGHGLLARARVDLGGRFHLDRCPWCGGIWFDAGEWSSLEKSGLLGWLEDFWTPGWQRLQREGRLAEDDRARLKRDLGEASFAELERLGAHLAGYPLEVRLRALTWLRDQTRVGPGRS